DARVHLADVRNDPTPVPVRHQSAGNDQIHVIGSISHCTHRDPLDGIDSVISGREVGHRDHVEPTDTFSQTGYGCRHVAWGYTDPSSAKSAGSTHKLPHLCTGQTEVQSGCLDG